MGGFKTGEVTSSGKMRASLTLLPLLAAAAYYLPRHLAPNPTYPHLYPPYLIRGYPDTAALENRQTIINDYITSQQMHHNAATAMAQRADILRGLSPRESSLALNYATGPRGGYCQVLQASGWADQTTSIRNWPDSCVEAHWGVQRTHACTRVRSCQGRPLSTRTRGWRGAGHGFACGGRVHPLRTQSWRSQHKTKT